MPGKRANWNSLRDYKLKSYYSTMGSVLPTLIRLRDLRSGGLRPYHFRKALIGRFCKENMSAKTPVFCCRCDNAPHVDVLITKILLSEIGTQVNLSQITVGLK